MLLRSEVAPEVMDLHCTRYGDGSQYYTRRRYLELDAGQENVRGVATHFAQRFYTPLWLHKVEVDNKAVHKKLKNYGIGEAHRHP